MYPPLTIVPISQRMNI